MRIIRYRLGDQVDYGVVLDETVHTLESGPFGPRRAGKAVASLSEMCLLAPCEPSKVVAVGINYAAHAAEHDLVVPGEPLLFLKPPSSVIGPGMPIVYPDRLSHWVEHEAELAVIIGRRGRHLSPDGALEAVLGFSCANDVTARDLQRSDGQWSRSKSFDTFCPLGPWIETELDPQDLSVRCWVNGELRQDGRTGDMLFSWRELIAAVSAVMTLEPGDVILTGTPAGVGALEPGDRVAVEIEGIGRLENVVVAPEE